MFRLRILVTFFLIPIAAAMTVLLQGLRGGLDMDRILMYLGIAAASFLIAARIWKRGLKQYSEASS